MLAMTFPEQSVNASARAAPELRVQPASELVAAAVRRFAHDHHPAALGTAIDWSTSIPRAVGLGGSSAMVIATLRALCELYGLALAPAELASSALAVEVQDLGIAAGWQDRVAQAYGGLSFMDFHPRHMALSLHGHREALEPAKLPPLLIAWREDAASDSGAVHGSLRQGFDRADGGERAVAGAMVELARHARSARGALLRCDRGGFARCVDSSFDARQRLMALDPRHVEMIRCARGCGASANYTGSGGAIVAVCRDGRHRDAVGDALYAIGCRTVRPTACRGV